LHITPHGVEKDIASESVSPVPGKIIHKAKFQRCGHDIAPSHRELHGAVVNHDVRRPNWKRMYRTS
jgi:hypothetical protein